MNAPTTEPLTESTADGVRAVIAALLGKTFEEVKADSTFEDLGADSLDTAELVMNLEDEFSIEIPDVDWERVKSVQGAIDVVNSGLVLAAAPKRHGVPA